ncbi:MAG: GDSL-type esterase/lipase family protein, partial [Flammeovirgaceae bacterium]
MRVSNIIVIGIALLRIQLLAQDTIAVEQNHTYTFIRYDENILSNNTLLSPFFEKLYQQKKNVNQKITILHIGDSHIQADFITHQIRVLLQKEFGNAGRGLVFPGRVGRTNEPFNIYSSTNTEWESKRIVFTDKRLPIGIGAMTLKTSQPNGKLSLRTINQPQLNYAFNKVTLFFQKDSSSYNVAVRDSVGQDVAFVGSFSWDGLTNASTVLLPYSINKLELQCLTPLPKQSQLVLFGLSLENQKPGILYHSVGGNGAKFKHYLSADLFFQQTALLQPDLIVVSLGTNEAIEYPYVDAQLEDQLKEFTAQLSTYNPKAKFLFTTTADFYKKRTRRNAGIEIIRKKIINACEKNGWGYWDLYEIAGGKHAADHWKKNKLLQNDGVHFTKAGYELQGSLFFEAVIKAYNEYVQYRHP